MLIFFTALGILYLLSAAVFFVVWLCSAAAMKQVDSPSMLKMAGMSLLYPLFFFGKK